MVLSVFLGLKNTPLSFLVHYSHDKLNFFHQAVGYTAVLQMLGHGLLYIARYQIQHRMEKLLEKDNMIGVVAGIFMLVLGCGALRRIKYEVFYISHIIGCIAALILTGLHRPNWVEKICIAMLLAAGLWSLDRIIRASRLLYNLASNNASVYPLADNAVKIVFKKQLFGAKAGSHCFIWIPGLRLFQTHPFTIVSNGPSGLELVIKAYDGFTKSLYDKAAMSPGLSLRASFDGPYGSFPDLAHYDKLVFLAGGSGATFTFGLVNSLLEQSGPETVQQVDFIWATKTKGTFFMPPTASKVQVLITLTESVYWFAEHLEKLNSHRSRVSSTVYITGEAQGSAYTSELETKTSEIGAKDTTNLPGSDLGKSKELSQSDSSLERQQGAQWRNLSEDISIEYGKLDVSSVIQAKIQDCQAGERVLVAACGPSSLLKATTDATARCITSKGPSIELHYEAFAW